MKTLSPLQIERLKYRPKLPACLALGINSLELIEGDKTQSVRDQEEWESWILFLLKGLEDTSQETVSLVLNIKELMLEYKQKIRSELPKIYSQDLLNNLFKHPYTKIDFICDELNISRPTATSYLNKLVDNGFLAKMKLGRDNFYLNMKLFDLLLNAFHIDKPVSNQQRISTLG